MSSTIGVQPDIAGQLSPAAAPLPQGDNLTRRPLLRRSASADAVLLAQRPRGLGAPPAEPQLFAHLDDPITLSRMQQPFVLTNCGHTFDRDTVPMLLDVPEARRKCPLCTIPITAPPKRNFMAQALLDVLQPRPRACGPSTASEAAPMWSVDAQFAPWLAGCDVRRTREAQRQLAVIWGGGPRHIDVAQMDALIAIAMAPLQPGLSPALSAQRCGIVLALLSAAHLGLSGSDAQPIFDNIAYGVALCCLANTCISHRALSNFITGGALGVLLLYFGGLHLNGQAVVQSQGILGPATMGSTLAQLFISINEQHDRINAQRTIQQQIFNL